MNTNPDSDPKPAQGNELDRGTGKTLPDDSPSPEQGTDHAKPVDDEMARPKNDRSPLT